MESRAGVLEKAYAAAQQEAQALHAKQRQLLAALGAAEKAARAGAAQQGPAEALQAELEQARASAATAAAEQELAQSRSSVLEKAYTAAVQEAQALQTKQRQLQAVLAESRKEVRAAVGQQAQIAGLAAELEAAQRAAAAASEQLALAHSRGGILEKAYAAATEVREKGRWCSVLRCCSCTSACAVGRSLRQRLTAARYTPLAPRRNPRRSSPSSASSREHLRRRAASCGPARGRPTRWPAWRRSWMRRRRRRPPPASSWCWPTAAPQCSTRPTRPRWRARTRCSPSSTSCRRRWLSRRRLPAPPRASSSAFLSCRRSWQRRGARRPRRPISWEAHPAAARCWSGRMPPLSRCAAGAPGPALALCA